MNQAQRRIHDAAIRLFAEQGNHRVSVSDLAQAAGVARGTIYNNIETPEYLFEQVSEIAVRALSPGINNPYTAMLCLNILAECIAYVNNSYLPNKVWMDDENRIKLIIKYTDYEGIIDKTFDRLRQQAKDDVSVAIKMIQMIVQLTQLELKPPILAALKKHAQLIYDDSMNNSLNRLDREDIRTNYNAILER